ncbi:MAG: diguanylate cyclase, partial [Gammaproteobacteria bacterium]
LDRVAQIASILIFGPVGAAWIVASGALIWPFSGRRPGDTWRRSLYRGLHNAGMFIVVILVSGAFYRAIGGAVPLTALTPSAFAHTLAMALVMQAVNELFMGINVLTRGIPLKEWFSPVAALVEIGSFPLALFAALIHATASPAVFGLFVVLLAAIIVVVSRLVDRTKRHARLLNELDAYKAQLENKVRVRTRSLEQQKHTLEKMTESLRIANEEKIELLTELSHKTEELDRLAHEDSLTGLHNRRFTDALLGAELTRAQRFDRPLSVALADLDRFKSINDEQSHAVGDAVLREVAALLRERCREVDTVGRHGGEEFLVVFPETPVEGAFAVCEDIRTAIEQHDWSRLAPGVRVTISIGVAALEPADDLDRLIARADRHLYAAKHAGRNKVAGPLEARELGAAG